METGIVKVTDLNGRGNKIFHSGDVVTPGNFPAGNWERLIKGGFITVKHSDQTDISNVEWPAANPVNVEKVIITDTENVDDSNAAAVNEPDGDDDDAPDLLNTKKKRNKK
jgi:hypothetical protein